MALIDRLKKRKLELWIIVVPLLVAILYYSVFAIDRYVSSAQISVKEASQADSGANSALPGLALMLGGMSTTSREETLYLRQYILSMDMMNILDQKLQWREHYIKYHRDPFYWLRSNESKEDEFNFYQRVITATFDSETGLLTVQVEAFDQGYAQQVLRVILASSEQFVNEISHKMAREQRAYAESEMETARKRYENKRDAMLRFQAENKLLDPETMATSRAQVIGDLETSLTSNSTKLNTLLATLNDSAPQVIELKNRIRAIQAQLQSETQRLVSAPSGDKLNVTAAQYRSLAIDAKIAEDEYKVSTTAVEGARIDATKKLRSLVTVVSPNLPDEALYPTRIYDLITVLVVLLLLYGVVRFVIITIDDHRD